MKKTILLLMLAFACLLASCAETETMTSSETDVSDESYEMTDPQEYYTEVRYITKDGMIVSDDDSTYLFVKYPAASEELCVGDVVCITYDEKDRVLSDGVLTEAETGKTYRWDEMIGKVAVCNVCNIATAKPVIYLYPTEPTVCSVKVSLQGRLTCTYPAHGTDGWQNFTAHPDGTLVFPDGKSYYCLYWEGNTDTAADLSNGFCIKGEDTAAFLEQALAELGLNEREANEFIIYWLPKLQENPYNVISFDASVYESLAELSVTPAPDSLLRVFMTAKGSDTYVELAPQTLVPFDRHGFAVVEWGGTLIE